MCFVFNIVSSINIEMYYLFLLQISRLLTGLLFHLTTSTSLCLVLMMRVTTRATSLHLFISLKNKWSHRLSHRVREKKHQQKAVCPGTSQAVFLYQVASNNKPIARCSPLKVPRGRNNPILGGGKSRICRESNLCIPAHNHQVTLPLCHCVMRQIVTLCTHPWCNCVITQC